MSVTRLSPAPNRRRLALLMAIVVLLGLSPGFAAAATGGRGRCRDTVPVRTFQVEMEAAKSSYAPGSIVTIHATVTRPSHDPAGIGQEVEPPASFPAAGAGVLVILKISGLEYVEFSNTNDEGKASVDIQIPSTAPAGPVPGEGLAWRTVINAPCVSVEEFGHVTDPDLVTIKG